MYDAFGFSVAYVCIYDIVDVCSVHESEHVWIVLKNLYYT